MCRLIEVFRIIIKAPAQLPIEENKSKINILAFFVN